MRCGSFAIFTGYTPIVPTDAVVIDVFVANGIIVLILMVLVGVETMRLVSAWRAEAAGARLHLYIVGLFSITAAVPAIIMAVVGSITLERGLYPAFMQDIRGFISHTADAARLYRESQCNALLREADLTASDLDRAKVGLNDRAAFQSYFTTRVHFLGFTTAVMMKSDGSIVERVDTGRPGKVVTPSPADFDDAKNKEPVCFLLDEGKTFVSPARRCRPLTIPFSTSVAPSTRSPWSFPSRHATSSGFMTPSTTIGARSSSLSSACTLFSR